MMYRSIGALTGMLVLCVTLTSCEWGKQSESERRQREISSGDCVRQVVVINVLDEEYYKDCHIKGSINVPFEKIEAYALEKLDKDKSYIVTYCANYMCLASSEAARQLKALGFKHVFAYEGGTAEWYHLSKENPDEGYLIEGPAIQQTGLGQYKKPAGYSEPEGVEIISAQDLKDLMHDAQLCK